jgi:hypothetical protein
MTLFPDINKAAISYFLIKIHKACKQIQKYQIRGSFEGEAPNWPFYIWKSLFLCRPFKWMEVKVKYFSSPI